MDELTEATAAGDSRQGSPLPVHDEYVAAEKFAQFVEAMPQACVELFIEHDGGVVLAKRTNEPAKGKWFWPGGRLYKGEQLEEAAHRVAEEELGIEVTLQGRFGVYSHFWETSGLPNSPSRHTVNVVYRARPTASDLDIELDSQHSEWRVLETREPDLHEYVRQYLADAESFE